MKFKILSAGCLLLLFTISCQLGKSDQDEARDQKGSDLDVKEANELEQIGNMPIKDISVPADKAKVEKLFAKLLKGFNLEGYAVAGMKSNSAMMFSSDRCLEEQKKVDFAGLNLVYSVEVEEKNTEIIGLPETQELNAWHVHLCAAKMPEIIKNHEKFKCGDKGKEMSATAAPVAVSAAGGGKSDGEKAGGKNAGSQGADYFKPKMTLIFANDQVKADACSSFLSDYLVIKLLMDTLPKTFAHVMKENKGNGGEKAVAAPPKSGDAAGAPKK